MKSLHLLILLVAIFVILFETDYLFELNIDDNDGTGAQKHFRSEYRHQEQKLVLRSFWKNLLKKMLQQN
jgi:hypothetical protein